MFLSQNLQKKLICAPKGAMGMFVYPGLRWENKFSHCTRGYNDVTHFESLSTPPSGFKSKNISQQAPAKLSAETSAPKAKCLCCLPPGLYALPGLQPAFSIRFMTNVIKFIRYNF